MTNYEMVKNFSIEKLALSIMCPIDTSLMKNDPIRCEEYRDNCYKCCLDWLCEEVE